MDGGTAPVLVKRSGLLSRCLIQIAGADDYLLSKCPQQDRNAVHAVAAIMVCTWCYQAGLYCLIGHKLFASPGQIRPELVGIAFFLASFILVIDSFMIMRSGWHLAGIQDLKRGGIDISGGFAVRVKAGCFLVVRILLSVCIAQMTALFLSLLIFGSDITAQIHSSYLQADAALIQHATALVDDERQRATDAVKAQSERVAAVATQLATLRQNQIDPSLGDPQMLSAQAEVTQLSTQKADADQAVANAEAFASRELGGIQGLGNSGIPGDGPRRKAAIEAAGNAKVQDQQIGAALDRARSRLDTLRTQLAATSQTTKADARDQLPSFQNTLATEDAKLAALKDQLATMTAHRDALIRATVENALDYRPADNGLLAQLAALAQIAHANLKIKAVVLLIDLTSFGFELAAVLAKVTSFVPMTYTALLARDTYLSIVRIADEMLEELESRPDRRSREADETTPRAPADKPAQNGTSETASGSAPGPFDNLFGPLTPTAKRPRGRPRKHPPADAAA